MTFLTGGVTAETRQCGQPVWEEDDDGLPVVVGRLATDGFATLPGEDGSVMTTTYGADETGFAIPDIVPLLAESHPAIGVSHGTLSFVSDAAD